MPLQRQVFLTQDVFACLTDHAQHINDGEDCSLISELCGAPDKETRPSQQEALIQRIELAILRINDG